MPARKSASPVPKACQIQAARLFGGTSRAAKSRERTPAEWKRVLQQTIDELFEYIEANVRTDEMHRMMLYSGLAASHEALKEKDFWPGYAEGVVRVALLLLGDYPDHRRRKPGRKKDTHYDLHLHRSVHFIQDVDQKVRTLFAAKRIGVPQLAVDPRDALSTFRAERGYAASYASFLDWYRQHHPEDYSRLF